MNSWACCSQCVICQTVALNVYHTVTILHHLLMAVRSVWNPPISSDSAFSCWQVICATSFRAEWGHPLAADHTGKQTNASGGVFVDGGWGVMPSGGCPQTLLKSSHSKSAQSQQKRGKEKPPVPFRPAGKWLNELKADIWEACSVPDCTAEQSAAKR